MPLLSIQRKHAIRTLLLLLSLPFMGDHDLAAQPVIGISKSAPNYVAWLQRSDPKVVWINLYDLPVEEAVARLNQCAGLLLTGGEDVYPGLHGKEADTARCTGTNRYRDSLDLALIRTALMRGIPILGICRGHQLLNVALGGDLIIDIPSDRPPSVLHQCEDYTRCHHTVRIAPNTLLYEIAGCDSALVTTNHHQAVDRLSLRLRHAAQSSDGIMESVEWSATPYPSFLLGVQWHPERMERSNPLSGKLADAFLKQSELYYNKKP